MLAVPVAGKALAVYDNLALSPVNMFVREKILPLRKVCSMTQPNKKGRKPQTARNIARRKYKERIKRQNAAKYAARKGLARA